MTWHATPLAESSDGLYVEVAKSHAKRNCLVIGPAGSGKLSLVRGLASLAYPRARKFLFDWEVEEAAQQKLLLDVHSRLARKQSTTEIWIHRRLHQLPEGTLELLLSELGAALETPNSRIVLYATISMLCEPHPCLSALDRVFGVKIVLGEGQFARGAFYPVLRMAIDSLKGKYSGVSTSIEPGAATLFEQCIVERGVPEALALLEKAYLRDGCKYLTTASMRHAMSLPPSELKDPV